ncbi:3-oxoacyl-[acyl-carrier-protein] reductase [Deltaproteobacteria bacterium TL4]
MDLQDRVALVTGASRGIGKAIALKLAEAGADIIITNRTQGDALPVVAAIESLGRKALAFSVDVSNSVAVNEMISQALERFGRIDILVNNAGITQDNLLMRMKLEEWNAVIEVNLNGMYHVTRAVIKTMVKQRYGRIVNLSSVVGFTGNPGQANYSTTKAGIIGFTKSVAKELGSRNITCNAVAPGYIETDMTQGLNEKTHEELLKQIPLKRIGTVEDIANAVEFLVSSKSTYISGTVLHVNGGMF